MTRDDRPSEPAAWKRRDADRRNAPDPLEAFPTEAEVSAAIARRDRRRRLIAISLLVAVGNFAVIVLMVWVLAPAIDGWVRRGAGSSVGATTGTATPPSAGGASLKTGPAGPLFDAAAKDVTAPVAVRTGVAIPESLKRPGVAGDVIVEVVVSAAGTVESATVRQTPDAVIGAVAARSVMDWQYRPASKAGVPVRYRLMARVAISR